jgi:hypothetical protein
VGEWFAATTRALRIEIVDSSFKREHMAGVAVLVVLTGLRWEAGPEGSSAVIWATRLAEKYRSIDLFVIM